MLAPAWLVALLAGLVGGGLWLLYPRQDLERRLASAAADTDVALSVAYLQNLLRSDPGNAQLHLLLARQHILLGEYGAARKELHPLQWAADPQIQREYLWQTWELDYAEYIATPETQEALRAKQRAALKERLGDLARHPWPAEREIRLSHWGAQFQDRAVALQSARASAERATDPREAARLYEQAARDALGVSDYESCAELYLLARRATPEPERAKAYFLSALDALQSGNRPADALALGEREIGPLIADPQVLLRMTQLARAAARPDVADRYVRKLLRLSLLQPTGAPAFADAGVPAHPSAWRLQPAAFLPAAPPPHAAAAAFDDGAHFLRPPVLGVPPPGAWRQIAMAQPGEPAAHTPGLPFDDKVYSLAYDVFLENRKPDDAWAIAQAAVRQRPHDMAWRERLAKVSEWTSRPGAALENWLAIAQQTQRDDAWQAVMRLAPGLFDDQAVIHALHYQLRRTPSDMRLVRQLVAAYERLGEPEAAIDYLDKHGRGIEARVLLAQLTERAGQPERALAYWQALLQQPEALTPANAMQAAVLALTLRQPELGLPWLEAARHQDIPEAHTQDYWRMTGQLAQNHQRNALAVEAYRKLVTLSQADASDFDALAHLLEGEHPLEAVRIREMAWERFAEPRYLVEALSFHVGRSQWSDAARLIRAVDAPSSDQHRAAAALMATPEYLRLTGAYYQNTGHPGRARAYYEAGLRAAPDSADMRSALLWLFIDSNDLPALRQLLARQEPTWGTDAELHDALAAAYQALSQPQTALNRYLRPRVRAHEKDFLWLMGYADALEQNQQADQAWRLRRHLLIQQRQQMQAGPAPVSRQQWLTEERLDDARRAARARLALAHGPGDPALGVLRELLRLDRNASGGLSNAAADTAIGWLLDAGETQAARGFLWHQYARAQGRGANQPLWATISVALAEDDKAATGQLLEAFEERLSSDAHIGAALAVGDVRRAQSVAFDNLGHQYDSDARHAQLAESLLAFSDQAQGMARSLRMPGLNERSMGETLHIALSPRLSVDVGHGRTLRKAVGGDVVVDPPQETSVRAHLRWRHNEGETLFTAARHTSFARYTPLEVEHEQPLDRRLSLRASLGMHLPTQDSLALRIAGMKDRASLALRYQASRRDVLTTTLWADRYQLQTGGALGSGRHASVQYTHTYRHEAPQLEFSVFASRHNYRRSDLSQLSARDQGYLRYYPPAAGSPGPDYFLPDSFSFYGVQVATNMRYEEEYSRKLRPYASVSATSHSRNGGGYGARLGIAGSVLGADHLRISWGYDKAGLRNAGATRELEISYRLHF